MSKENDNNARREWRRKIKTFIGWAIGIGIVGWIAYLVVTAERLPPSEFEATTGIHYHPRLVIKQNGENLIIPNNIGLGVTHNPIHTHEDGDGTIHLEFEGKVRRDDIQLGKFFTVWGKEWTATSFMGMPLGDGHTLTMTVNGVSSVEYGSYVMHDKDLIELDYR